MNNCVSLVVSVFSNNKLLTSRITTYNCHRTVTFNCFRSLALVEGEQRQTLQGGQARQSLPVGGAPSERNYSLAAQGASQRRAALSTSSVNALLLINSTRTPLN